MPVSGKRDGVYSGLMYWERWACHGGEDPHLARIRTFGETVKGRQV